MTFYDGYVRVEQFYQHDNSDRRVVAWKYADGFRVQSLIRLSSEVDRDGNPPSVTCWQVVNFHETEDRGQALSTAVLWSTSNEAKA